MNGARGKAVRAGPRDGSGEVRIIGGRWRGTRLPVPALPGLRPSSDRARETLFNWLLPKLAGARVLDAFAGTGALGLEAVSRGAAHATLVEREPAAAAQLRATVARLGAATMVQVVQDDVLAWLGTAGQGDEAYDVAFLDPPFEANLWAAAVPALLPALAPGAWLYVETPPEQALGLPEGWALHREGRTREVRYALYRAPE